MMPQRNDNIVIFFFFIAKVTVFETHSLLCYELVNLTLTPQTSQYQQSQPSETSYKIACDLTLIAWETVMLYSVLTVTVSWTLARFLGGQDLKWRRVCLPLQPCENELVRHSCRSCMRMRTRECAGLNMTTLKTSSFRVFKCHLEMTGKKAINLWWHRSSISKWKAHKACRN